MRHFAPCLLLSLSLCASATAAELDIAVTADPGTVYLERVPAGQAVNFELLFDNPGAVPVDIDRIEVSAFDAHDGLLLRRFIDGNGVRPGLAVLGARTIPAGEKLAVFNPFHEFAAELPIARLHFTVAMSNTDGSVRVARELDVRPVAYRNPASLRLPLAGPAINHDGHDFLGHHRRFDVHFAPIAAMGFTRPAKCCRASSPTTPRGAASASRSSRSPTAPSSRASSTSPTTGASNRPACANTRWSCSATTW
jgi:hypothetical protein